MRDAPPLYDDAGINVADPHDRRGLKTRYISLLQIEALRRCVVAPNGTAADVGCGYGRMSEALASLGFSRVIGIEPSDRLVAAARERAPQIEFRQGGLPDLPLAVGEASTIFLLNVLRPLHLLGCVDVAAGCAAALSSGGRLVVLDNLRANHRDYLGEDEIVGLFARTGLVLRMRRVIRGSRWPWTLMVRYGLVPTAWHAALARFELAWMKWFQRTMRWQYVNVIWVFEKP